MLVTIRVNIVTFDFTVYVWILSFAHLIYVTFWFVFLTIIIVYMYSTDDEIKII